MYMPRRLFLPGLLLGISLHASGPAPVPATTSLERGFAQTVQPFVNSYCVVCHSGKAPAAQLDLKSFHSVADVVQDYPHWNTLLEKLQAEQMPPKEAKQPSAEARKAIIEWVKAVRTSEARKHAGDPGPVLARRLSNAEYNYTIRDLTGADIRPTREFPVDPANTAGFDNSGESLTMSPALLNKYLQAAREVADHMVLTPRGIDFAASPMLVETDRDQYAIKRIVDFYLRQPTNYADYFDAAWRYRNRVKLGKPRATLASIAAEQKVSAKYLPMVWGILEETPDAVGPIATLQTMWRALPAATSKQPDDLYKKCVEMRDFVQRIRNHTAMQFAAPIVRGLPAGSQALLDWKLRQFASHRRDSDPNDLRNDTDGPLIDLPRIPRYPGLHQEGAPRWKALTAHARADDADLIVPAAERSRYEAAFQKFAQVFPDAFFWKERGRYFPDDSDDKGRLLSASNHNVMGYFRDDTPLSELILDDKGGQQLDDLWDEFDFIAHHTARTWDQYYFNQSGEVFGKGAEEGSPRPKDAAVDATSVIMGLRDVYIAKAKERDTNDPVAAQAVKEHFESIDHTLRRLEKMHSDAEPYHLDALLDFAARAFRRPLSTAERDGILAYYQTLRKRDSLSHEDAVRDSIVSVLMSPKFCYRLDIGERGKKTRPLNNYELASRLSYFLWSSIPDRRLLAHAASGDLRRPEVLLSEARRMMKDPKARGMAIEFGGNWLDFRRFEEINTVDRERFPAFDNGLREAMFQEPVRFIEDVVRNNRSVLDMLYANRTFVNPELAKHYGMGNLYGDADHWVSIENADRYGHGGILTMGAFLTQNAPGLRTSPVKRGYWVVRRVLGENIPPPPPVVPELPKDEAKMDLPLRDMLAQHRNNPACAGCHTRFDTVGMAFENYGPVGERRAKDLAGHKVDTKAVFPGNVEGEGYQGVQDYIRTHREKDFTGNLSRKLLAYALGRSLQISDDLTVDQMQAKLVQNGYRFAPLVETIVTSPQFLNRRGE